MENLGQLTPKQETDLAKLRELHQKALTEQERVSLNKLNIVCLLVSVFF